MFFRYFSIWLVLLFASQIAKAQEEETSLEELLSEQLNEDLGENVDLSEVLERLSNYRKYPLDLNTANESELSNLIFLNALQIEKILYHREFTGRFINILELQGIQGLDLSTIQLLRYFVKVGETSVFKDLTWKQIFNDNEQMLMFRYGRNIEKAKGYAVEDEERSRYLGDPNRYALRYRWNFEHKIKIAINAEKDAGEPFFKEKQRYGFDFYGGHLELNNVSSTLKKVVIGDYALQFGQGLVSWNGLSFGKGAWVGAIARQGMGLKAYSSMNEQNFQRGLAATYEHKGWEWTPFIAFNSLSGNVKDVDEEKTISTINMSGLHRTPTELSYRDEVKQWVYGANITYKHKRLKVGLTYQGLQFNGTVLSGTDLREQFDFEGKSLQQIGLHYNYTYRNYYVFGETAHSFGGGLATNNGVIASLHPKVSVFGNYRNYQRNYHNFYGQSLGEGSAIANEKGVYTGLIYHITRKVEWTNYIDVFQFPWLRFRVDAPSSGKDFLSQFVYTWYKKGQLTLRYRHRLRQENQNLPDKAENLLADITRSQFRIDFQYKLSDTWQIRTRGEYSVYRKELASTSKGYLIYQDIFWKGLKNRLNLSGRLAYFNTESYDSRIYAYENDVLYASSFPMYYDKGVRGYVNAKVRISRNLDFWLRYALTKYQDRETVGSGLEEIEGNNKSDFKLQLRWQW